MARAGSRYRLPGERLYNSSWSGIEKSKWDAASQVTRYTRKVASRPAAEADLTEYVNDAPVEFEMRYKIPVESLSPAALAIPERHASYFHVAKHAKQPYDPFFPKTLHPAQFIESSENLTQNYFKILHIDEPEHQVLLQAV
ncbi:hypothetical protein T265_05831 [Opisthorchis viverrini]|uniref:Uncharacterized protein n=1 Tax=Opisthorchis viverrini TaxID=6198 RepID=A0A075AEU6_OPIVI|nr:hypothetical protein T265_05831 [Opisthorchis viverrini]KER27074.1 hypothetical protein T265_05831 [Opisthorchis viverrini]